jgi:hypothetical protein
VVDLDDTQVDDLVEAYAPEPTSEAPSVVDGMREHLPPGPFWAGTVLDGAFQQERWWASVYLDPQRGQLVLVATGT